MRNIVYFKVKLFTQILLNRINRTIYPNVMSEIYKVHV